jgi:uncharacterized YkwD family protein
MKKSRKLVYLLVAVLVLSSTASYAGGFNYSVVRVNQNNNVSRLQDCYNFSNYSFKRFVNVIIGTNTPSRPGTIIELPTRPVEVEEPAKPVEEPKTPEVPEEPEAPIEEPKTPEVPETPVEEPTKPVEEPKNPPVEEEQNYSGLSADESEVVRLVNIEREKAGLKPLKASSQLSKVARMKSKDMAENNYFSHTSPTYGSPFDMMRQFGINYRTAGENIAKGYLSPASVMNGWMNSSGHRANILNPNFGTIGVGAYKVGSTIYWTQMFTN